MSKKSKRSRRVFSNEFKQDAVDLVVKPGDSLRAVAEAVNVSSGNVAVLVLKMTLSGESP